VDTANTAAYYDFDAIGSTSEITSAGGQWLNRYAYGPFGNLLLKTETVPNAFRYVGQYDVVDSGNGLLSMRARFFSPTQGRFVSEDPAGVNGEDVNLYTYVVNNPIRFIDPNGNFLFIPGIPPEVANPPPIIIPYVPPPPVLKPYTPPPQEPKEPENRPHEPHHGDPEDEDPNSPENKDRGKPKDKSEGLPPTPAPPPEPGGEGGEGGDCNPIGPLDPNDKLGPIGFGDLGFVAADARLSYTIDFENVATATAPAQVVTVTDQLDSDLDWRTLQLSEITFGSHTITVPAGRSFFATTVDLRPDGQNLLIQIDAGIDPTTGTVHWTFVSIDPATGEAPTDALLGFLPPNDAANSGQGHVTYTVRPRAGDTTGTTIANRATIVFDTEVSIDTNLVSNTLDASAPASTSTRSRSSSVKT
jgi:RHS repeat-associated protein